MNFNYKWRLEDENFSKDKGSVFSCFSGGGGSSMGYLRAGFDVVGCNEIDPKMMETYKANLNPKYAYLESIEDFKKRDDLPLELYSLDILDGSPPCSSFSFAGNREKDWGKEKKFREGQANQVLDTLFFDFIDLAKKLQPKVVIAENVTGLLLGSAIDYVRRIYSAFDDAGYYCEHHVIDASKMGVPQRRERVFFVCLRKDLASQFLYKKDLFTEVPKINFEFNENEIPFARVQEKNVKRKSLTEREVKIWGDCDHYGMYDKRSEGGKKLGYFRKLVRWRVCGTILSGGVYAIQDKPKKATDKELVMCSSFPLDYDFFGSKAQYVLGMSVPPTMTAQISKKIYDQWLAII